MAEAEIQKLAAYVEYDGHDFVGWQSQDGLRSVQAEVERALGKVAAHPVQVRCAGRTDAGVHALGQVVHFESRAQRRSRGWILGSNTHLPPDINIYWVGPVAGDFDARFRALSRSYRFLILNAQARSAIWAKRCLYEPRPLDVHAMQLGAQALIGTHDFSTFRGRDCQAKSPVKTVHSLHLRRHADWVILDIEAGGFLHNMVRNIVGTLMEVGRGAKSPDWVGSALASRERRQCGPTVAPCGLYFLGAKYEEHFGLPPFRSQILPFPLD